MPQILNTKTEECDLNILVFTYSKDLALDSVKAYFLEVGAYVSLKRGATGV